MHHRKSKRPERLTRIIRKPAKEHTKRMQAKELEHTRIKPKVSHITVKLYPNQSQQTGERRLTHMEGLKNLE